MISKSGPVLHSYQVNTTTETSDEGRNRGDRKNQQNKSAQNSTPEKDEAKNSDRPSSDEADKLPRQLIDSEKVLELLAHTPPTTPVGNPFSKCKKIPLDIDRKKLNRNL